MEQLLLPICLYNRKFTMYMSDSGEGLGGGVYGIRDGVNVVVAKVFGRLLVLILFSTRFHIHTPECE